MVFSGGTWGPGTSCRVRSVRPGLRVRGLLTLTDTRGINIFGVIVCAPSSQFSHQAGVYSELVQSSRDAHNGTLGFGETRAAGRASEAQPSIPLTQDSFSGFAWISFCTLPFSRETLSSDQSSARQRDHHNDSRGALQSNDARHGSAEVKLRRTRRSSC